MHYHCSLSLLYSNSTKAVTPNKVHEQALLLVSQAISCDRQKRVEDFCLYLRQTAAASTVLLLSLPRPTLNTVLKVTLASQPLCLQRRKNNNKNKCKSFTDHLSDWEVILKSWNMRGTHPTKDQFSLSFLQQQHVISSALPHVQQYLKISHGKDGKVTVL